jgi:hypothetical protein
MDAERGLTQRAADVPPGLESFQLDMQQRIARSMLKMAEAAAAKHCNKTARQTYLEVIDTFTGSGYTAERQRAQIGIDDLRAFEPEAKDKGP